MILTVAELRQHIETDESDQVLSEKLLALELLVRAYTNNNFQVRAFRTVAVAISEGRALVCQEHMKYKAGDTIQISDSAFMPDALVTVSSVDGTIIIVNEELYDEAGVVVTKIAYPVDVKMGVVNLMKWELENRDKVGVSSETISRHSVTYFDMNGDNSLVGYPKALVGFLKPYQKARFGRGIGV